MYLEKGVGRMKLKFVDQPYQTDAVNAICDIFDGCEVKDSLFTIEVDNHNKLNMCITFICQIESTAFPSSSDCFKPNCFRRRAILFPISL